MRQADQALTPPMARPVCARGLRVHETRSVREIQNRIIRTTCAAPSRVPPVPGLDGAFGSGGRTRVSAGNSATDVAFTVVRRVIKLACAVPESRVRARLAALGPA